MSLPNLGVFGKILWKKEVEREGPVYAINTRSEEMIFAR